MIKIPVLAGSYFDISQFDFSVANIKILEINNPGVDDYIREMAHDNFENNIRFIGKIREELKFEYEKRFLIIKDSLDNFDYEDVLNCWKILLIMYPSDLQIQHVLHFDNSVGFYQCLMMETYHLRITGDGVGKLLMSSSSLVPMANAFIALVFFRLKQNNYLSVAIENYIQSYNASHFHFQFLGLLFSIETIVEQEQELSYRLKRFVAILCGEKPYNCNIIFQNINELYKIRSKIVHGGNMSNVYDDLLSHLKTLQAISSQTIIELLVHNVTSISDLNKKLTVLGYGDKARLSDNYQEFSFNITNYNEVNWATIKVLNDNDPFVQWLSNLGD